MSAKDVSFHEFQNALTVSKNRGTPKSSILMNFHEFSIIFTVFSPPSLGVLYLFLETPTSPRRNSTATTVLAPLHLFSLSALAHASERQRWGWPFYPYQKFIQQKKTWKTSLFGYPNVYFRNKWYKYDIYSENVMAMFAQRNLKLFYIIAGPFPRNPNILYITKCKIKTLSLHHASCSTCVLFGC